jgi:hypothetical protein
MDIVNHFTEHLIRESKYHKPKEEKGILTHVKRNHKHTKFGRFRYRSDRVRDKLPLSRAAVQIHYTGPPIDGYDSSYAFRALVRINPIGMDYRAHVLYQGVTVYCIASAFEVTEYIKHQAKTLIPYNEAMIMIARRIVCTSIQSSGLPTEIKFDFPSSKNEAPVQWMLHRNSVLVPQSVDYFINPQTDIYLDIRQIKAILSVVLPAVSTVKHLSVPRMLVKTLSDVEYPCDIRRTNLGLFEPQERFFVLQKLVQQVAKQEALENAAISIMENSVKEIKAWENDIKGRIAYCYTNIQDIMLKEMALMDANHRLRPRAQHLTDDCQRLVKVLQRHRKVLILLENNFKSTTVREGDNKLAILRTWIHHIRKYRASLLKRAEEAHRKMEMLKETLMLAVVSQTANMAIKMRKYYKRACEDEENIVKESCSHLKDQLRLEYFFLTLLRTQEALFTKITKSGATYLTAVHGRCASECESAFKSDHTIKEDVSHFMKIHAVEWQDWLDTLARIEQRNKDIAEFEKKKHLARKELELYRKKYDVAARWKMVDDHVNYVLDCSGDLLELTLEEDPLSFDGLKLNAVHEKLKRIQRQLEKRLKSKTHRYLKETIPRMEAASRTSIPLSWRSTKVEKDYFEAPLRLLAATELMQGIIDETGQDSNAVDKEAHLDYKQSFVEVAKHNPLGAVRYLFGNMGLDRAKNKRDREDWAAKKIQGLFRTRAARRLKKELKRESCARRIQSRWRYKKLKNIFLLKIRQNWDKTYSPVYKQHGYVNNRIGEWQWHKPKLFTKLWGVDFDIKTPRTQKRFDTVTRRKKYGMAELEACLLIQKAFRYKSGINSVHQLIASVWVREYDRSIRAEYYYNRVTGVTRWDKPLLAKNVNISSNQERARKAFEKANQNRLVSVRKLVVAIRTYIAKKKMKRLVLVVLQGKMAYRKVSGIIKT